MFLAPGASFRGGGGGGVIGIAQFRRFLPFFLTTQRFRNKESRIFFNLRNVYNHKSLLKISIRQTIFRSMIIDHVVLEFNQKTQQKISPGLVFVKECSKDLSVNIG